MNYKLLDRIAMEVARNLKVQQQQDLLAEMWRPYMKDLDTMYTDAACYESEMRYPTDPKLLWEGIEKAYKIMCGLSDRLGLHRPRTKSLDVQKANLTYRKQRRRTKSQTRRMTRRLLELLAKILKETRRIVRENAGTDNRELCKEKGIQTSFVKRGRPYSEEKKAKDLVRKELARVRATAMEGSFGTQKEHYSLRRVKARKKETEIMYIFFGIHTANVVQLAARIAERQQPSEAA